MVGTVHDPQDSITSGEGASPTRGTSGTNNPQSGSARLYIIIGFLLAAIVVGVLLILLPPPGKIAIRVESFAPIDVVLQTTNFTVEFSQNVVGDSLVGVLLDDAPIRFTPPIPGKYRWLDRHKIRFFPEVQLLPSTTYQAEILPKIARAEDTYLDGERKFVFHTPRFRVESSSLSLGIVPEREGEVTIQGTVEFNYPVDVEAARGHLSIGFEGGRAISYQILTSKPSRIIELETEPISRGESDRRVRLQISRRLLPVDGNRGLSDDYTKLKTLKAQDLKVEGVFPEQRGRYGYLKIRFNVPVDVDMARRHITLEPEIDYRVVASHRYVELRGDFEAGQGYTVTVHEGLIGVGGAVLKKEFSGRVVVKNMEPTIDLVGEGVYLPREGNLNLGLATTNVDKVQIQIHKVFANNIIYLMHQHGWRDEGRRRHFVMRNLGREIHREEISIDSKLNEEVITPIDLKPYVGGERLGIFSVIATHSSKRWFNAQRWAMITDLGIIAKMTDGELWTWVHSLSSLQPVSGAEVTLISKTNQTLLHGYTDGDGLARFTAIEEAMDDFSPFLITAQRGQDLSFVELDRGRLSTAEFDVDGAAYLKHGYDAFVYTDRGVYRPGERAHVVALLRGPQNTVPMPFPARMVVTGPHDRIVSEYREEINEEGAAEFEVDLADYIRTGRYTAKILVGEKQEIGRTTFNVEEFMPDRIKVKVETEEPACAAGDVVRIAVEAVNLFGPPAADRRTEAQCDVEARTFSPPGWQAFSFIDKSRSFEKKTINLGEATLDGEGKHTFNLTVPSGIKPPSTLQGIISVTVHEPGGRAVSAYSTVDIHPYSHYVGLRRSTEGYMALDEPVEVEFVVVDEYGEIAPDRKCEVSCYRITWQSILKRVGGRRGYRYVSERQETLVKSFAITSGNDVGKFTFTPEDYGRYRVQVRDVGSDASASVSFYASGWGYVPWAMEHPDRLEIDLDKAIYRPGETARIQIKAPFSGRVLLTVERHKIFYHRSFIMEENTATVDIPVGDEHKPNTYVCASVIRSTESLERHAPVRALGIAPLMVDCGQNELTVSLNVPDETRPQRQLTIPFEVAGSSGGAFLTIAAVDEGILQLTDFQTPDPFGFFFGKKRLAVDSYDLYAAILPEVERAPSSSSPGGGREEEIRKKHLTPVSVKRVKPVSLWSGLVRADGEGHGTVTFEIPAFNGALRIMAVSFTQDRFGSSTAAVVVRNPIVLTPTIPRFISGGDRFRIPVSLFNGTGREDQFTVSFDVDGPVKMPENPIITLTLKPEEERQVHFWVTALRMMGEVKFTIRAKGGGEMVSTTTEVPLRPAAPPVTLTGSGSAKEGVFGSFTFPGDWVEGTTEFEIILSSFPAIEFSGSLQYLLRYPHGCAEQTTSRVFPLLYFDDVAKLVEPELFGTKSADYFVEEGIAKLSTMQMSSGDFAYWPGGDRSNPWTSIYVSHFLVEARRAGYTVPNRVYRGMIDALRRAVAEPGEERHELQVKAYACYVLAAAGSPDKSSMLYLKNNALEKMRDVSQFQLAGAFALSGDRGTALSLLPVHVMPQEVERETGGTFNSSARATAIVLDVLSEISPAHPSIPELVKRLTSRVERRRRWYTTQENAFAFLALGKILRKQTPGQYRGSIAINDAHYADFDSRDHRYSDEEWSRKTVTIDIQGTGSCYYYWRAFGIPTGTAGDEFDSELVVRRRYLDRNGDPMAFRNFKHGELIIAEITCKSLTENVDNVIVADLLPAGFEIENPRLESRQGLPWIGEGGSRPDYMDIRDDRIIFFSSVPRNAGKTFFYGLRAVTVGDFILPPAKAEAMYDPGKSSVASSGAITVNEW